MAGDSSGEEVSIVTKVAFLMFIVAGQFYLFIYLSIDLGSVPIWALQKFGQKLRCFCKCMKNAWRTIIY